MNQPAADKDDLYETRQIINFITKNIPVEGAVRDLLLRAAQAGQTLGYARGYRDGWDRGVERQQQLLADKIKEIKKRKGL